MRGICGMSLTTVDGSLPIIGGGGVWMPHLRGRCDGNEPQGLEVVEEGRTYDLDVDDLQDRINAHHPTTFYIYYQQDGTRGSHMRDLGGHSVPDLTSPRWDYFTPPPSFFRTRRAVNRSPLAVHKLRNPGRR